MEVLRAQSRPASGACMTGRESTMAPTNANRLKARRLGVDTQFEAVVFMHKDCPVCRSEGFSAHTRIVLSAGNRQIIATLFHVTSDLLAHDEAALSESAWIRLGLQDGDTIIASHPDPIESLSHVRSRIYGNQLDQAAMNAIIGDVVDGRYSDIHLSALLTAGAARPLHDNEVLALTRAMVEAGDRLSWNSQMVLDKHSVGGLPGNRTSPVVVSIIASLG